VRQVICAAQRALSRPSKSFRCHQKKRQHALPGLFSVCLLLSVDANGITHCASIADAAMCSRTPLKSEACHDHR